MIISLLGRQPALGLAELEARYGAGKISKLGSTAALLDIEPDQIQLAQLGGTVKLARHLATIPSTQWSALSSYCQEYFPAHLPHLEAGKVTFGLSVYGVKASTKQLERTALTLKKLIRAQGRSVRVVPNKTLALNSAQVLHNKLTEPLGVELVFFAHQGKTFLGQTIAVQDIEAYAERDFTRPMRDAFVGMLPPKLAQIILNLGLEEKSRTATRVLDPFCGTGVVLQEAALMGCPVYGTDINERMVRYARDNLQWLEQTHHFQIEHLFETADATTHHWRQPVEVVVAETYLGPPLDKLPGAEKMHDIVHQCNQLVADFLKNLRPQLKKSGRICLAVPAWKQKYDFIHLPVVDDLKKLGYNRISFSHARREDLVYFRPDQTVARELLILTVL